MFQIFLHSFLFQIFKISLSKCLSFKFSLKISVLLFHSFNNSLQTFFQTFYPSKYFLKFFQEKVWKKTPLLNLSKLFRMCFRVWFPHIKLGRILIWIIFISGYSWRRFIILHCQKLCQNDNSNEIIKCWRNSTALDISPLSLC